MFEVALDTVSLQHAVRFSKKSRKQGKQPQLTLDARICEGRVRIVVDRNGALLEEYRRTCGEEIVGVLITKWDECKGIAVISKVPKLPLKTKRKLRDAGFTGTMDKLVLALAIASGKRAVVSDDGDFWDPRDHAQLGDDEACVVRLCRDELQVSIMLLAGLLAQTK